VFEQSSLAYGTEGRSITIMIMMIRRRRRRKENTRRRRRRRAHLLSLDARANATLPHAIVYAFCWHKNHNLMLHIQKSGMSCKSQEWFVM
jgi:hypothetical protein